MSHPKLSREQAEVKVLREIAAQWSPEDLEELPAKILDKMSAATGKSTGELTGGLAGTCSSCPSNEGLTQSATQGQAYGCLPSHGDIVQMKRISGQNWACHDDETRICAGLCHSAKEEGLDLRTGGLISYKTWYYEGPEVAMENAAAQLRGSSATHGEPGPA